MDEAKRTFVSVAEKCPQLVGEWDSEANGDMTPENTPHASHKTVTWVCPDCGERYMAPVYWRTARNSKCPYCSGKRARSGVNSLAALYPDIADEWDMNRNAPLTPDEVTPGSNRAVWWCCRDGHHWLTTVQTRVNAPSCLYCRNMRPPIPRLV